MATVDMGKINKMAEESMGPREGVSPAEKKTKKTKKAKVVATGKKPAGIGAFCKKLITEHPDWNNQRITDKANAKFPDGKTSRDCVAWYRSRMRRDAMEAAAATKK